MSKEEHIRMAASLISDVIWELKDAGVAVREQRELCDIQESLQKWVFVADMANRDEEEDEEDDDD